MLLYALLHLTGYDLSLDDIKSFRQLHSKTPGHPENFATPGVEMATGPLGQGLSTAVGMAIAEEHLRALYGDKACSHFTYVIASDGDLMEGVAQEACSLAGHLGLGRLIVLYDDNSITIDGNTSLAFTENTPAKFEAMGWHVSQIDGMDVEAVDSALTPVRRVHHGKARTAITWKGDDSFVLDVCRANGYRGRIAHCLEDCFEISAAKCIQRWGIRTVLGISLNVDDAAILTQRKHEHGLGLQFAGTLIDGQHCRGAIALFEVETLDAPRGLHDQIKHQPLQLLR